MAVKARAEITLTSIRDVQSVTRYYLLQSSTSAAPAKPTTNPPGGNWVTSEPTYTSGSTNSLYFTDCTVFSDGTFVYSDVSLSSSYEAAKVAYNKAVSAEGVANSASDKVDNLEVGGRNLVRRTDYSIYGNSNNYANANQAIFSSDRITIPFGKEVWQNQYTRNELKTPIPKGTKIITSVYVYEQTVPDGDHRLYVAGLRSNGTVNWYSNYKVIPYGFVGKFTWEYTTLEDFYGFLLDFDTRNGTSGQIVLGPVKTEIGTLATDWTPAPEDIEADISAANALAQSAKEGIDNFEVGGRNLYVVKDAQDGYIDRSNGNVLIGSKQAINKDQTSDFIPVIEGEKLVLQAWSIATATDGNGSAQLGYAFYDSEKVYLSPRTYKSDGTIQADGYTYIFYKITVPANAAFIRCTYRRNAGGKAKLERGSVATDWTPAPEDIEADISASQATADSKNTVYYQASAPSGGTYKVNDIWFETDNGNKMYMWNGTAWTAETFGTAAISDLSITNAKIANATIQSAKIANLDAGKVTTGTMSAARIKGDILTLGGANNVDGMLKVYDANGTLVGSFTREGLMAIAGTIGGWTIGATQLYNTYLEDGAIQHSAAFSPTDELQFSVSDNGTGTTMLDVHDRTAIYGSNGINFDVRTLDDEWYQSYVAPRGDDYGVRIGPALDVYGPLSSSSMKSSSLELQTNMGSYIRQPAMILSGVTTISTGTSEKNLTLCTVPTEYQSGYRIVPFVSRRYGSASGTPSDTGDFYYAYYNSITHNVHIKLANKLPSGTIFQFDYMIYAVPES